MKSGKYEIENTVVFMSFLTEYYVKIKPCGFKTPILLFKYRVKKAYEKGELTENQYMVLSN